MLEFALKQKIKNVLKNIYNSYLHMKSKTLCHEYNTYRKKTGKNATSRTLAITPSHQ